MRHNSKISGHVSSESPDQRRPRQSKDKDGTNYTNDSQALKVRLRQTSGGSQQRQTAFDEYVGRLKQEMAIDSSLSLLKDQANGSTTQSSSQLLATHLEPDHQQSHQQSHSQQQPIRQVQLKSQSRSSQAMVVGGHDLNQRPPSRNSQGRIQTQVIDHQQDYMSYIQGGSGVIKGASNSSKHLPSHHQQTESFKQLVPLVELQKQRVVAIGPRQDEQRSAASQAPAAGKQQQQVSLYAPSSQAVVHEMLAKQSRPQQPSQRRINSSNSQKTKATGAASKVELRHNVARRGSNKSQEPIPAYTSEEARVRNIKGKEKYPADPSKYRKVNKIMDKELKWYKTEIEKRFQKSSCRDYTMQRHHDDLDEVTSGIDLDPDIDLNKHISLKSVNASDQDYHQEPVGAGSATTFNESVRVSNQQSISDYGRGNSHPQPPSDQASTLYGPSQHDHSNQLLDNSVLTYTDFQATDGPSSQKYANYEALAQAQAPQDEDVDTRQSIVQDEGQPAYKQVGLSEDVQYILQEEEGSFQVHEYIVSQRQDQVVDLVSPHHHNGGRLVSLTDEKQNASGDYSEVLFSRQGGGREMTDLTLQSYAPLPKDGELSYSQETGQQQKLTSTGTAKSMPKKLAASFSKVELKKAPTASDPKTRSSVRSKPRGAQEPRKTAPDYNDGIALDARSRTLSQDRVNKQQTSTPGLKTSFKTSQLKQNRAADAKPLSQSASQIIIDETRVTKSLKPKGGNQQQSHYSQFVGPKVPTETDRLTLSSKSFTIGPKPTSSVHQSIESVQPSIISKTAVQAKRASALRSNRSGSNSRMPTSSVAAKSKRSGRGSSAIPQASKSLNKSRQLSAQILQSEAAIATEEKPWQSQLFKNRVNSKHQVTGVSSRPQVTNSHHAVASKSTSQTRASGAQAQLVPKKTRNKLQHQSLYSLIEPSSGTIMEKPQLHHSQAAWKDSAIDMIKSQLKTNKSVSKQNARDANRSLKMLAARSNLKQLATDSSIEMKVNFDQPLTACLQAKTYNKSGQNHEEDFAKRSQVMQVTVPALPQETQLVDLILNTGETEDSYEGPESKFGGADDQSQDITVRRKSQKSTNSSLVRGGQGNAQQRRSKKYKDSIKSLFTSHATQATQAANRGRGRNGGRHNQSFTSVKGGGPGSSNLVEGWQQVNKGDKGLQNLLSFNGSSKVVQQAYESGTFQSKTGSSQDFVMNRLAQAQSDIKPRLNSSLRGHIPDSSLLHQTTQSPSQLFANSQKQNNTNNDKSRQQRQAQSKSFYDESSKSKIEVVPSGGLKSRQQSINRSSFSRQVNQTHAQSSSKLDQSMASASGAWEINNNHNLSGIVDKKPKKQRQAQNYIDLEAIKKSISRKIAQGNGSSNQRDNFSEVRLLAALSQPNLVKNFDPPKVIGTKHGTIMSQILSSDYNMGSQKAAAKQLQVSHQASKSKGSLNSAKKPLQNETSLQKVLPTTNATNQSFSKKTKKQRSQGLILNQSQVALTQAKHASVLPSSQIAMNKPLHHKAPSRNETFSMSQDGFVLTASRSKVLKPSLSSSKTFIAEAYQTPGIYLGAGASGQAIQPLAQSLLSKQYSHQKSTSINAVSLYGTDMTGVRAIVKQGSQVGTTSTAAKRKVGGSVSMAATNAQKLMESSYQVTASKRRPKNGEGEAHHTRSSNQIIKSLMVKGQQTHGGRQTTLIGQISLSNHSQRRQN